MEIQTLLIGIVIGIVIGGFIGWLFAKSKLNELIQSEKEVARLKLNELEKEFEAYQDITSTQLQSVNEHLIMKVKEFNALNVDFKAMTVERYDFSDQLSTVTANLKTANQSIAHS